MGYRNPLTTAAAVDTGHGLADAGVRVYQDLSIPAVPKGVAEWRTGRMDPGGNATAILSGGGSGGSSFVVQGGKTQTVQAPALDLNVEQLPGGGYGPVARLVTGAGGQAFTDAPLIGPDTKWQALPLVTTGALTFTAFDAGNAPRYARLADGTVILEGIAKILAGTLAAGASAQAGSLPASLAPVMNAWRPAVIMTSAGAYFAAGEVLVNAGTGNVTVFNTTGGAFGAGASFSIAAIIAPASSLTT
jgi:hypothetical protein